MKVEEADVLLDQPEAAREIGVSESTVQRERQRGRLGFYRVAGWRVKYSRKKHIQPYLETYCQPAARPNQKRDQAAA